MRLDDVVADLMRTSGDRLLRLAYQLCHDRAGAEDLVQEAFTRVYGSWLRRRPDVEHAEAYLRRAVVNEFLRRRRLGSSTELVTDREIAVVIGAKEATVRSLALRGLQTLRTNLRTEKRS